VVTTLCSGWPASMTALEGEAPQTYRSVPARKTIVWLSKSLDDEQQYSSSLSAFLDQLQKPAK